MKLKRWSVVRMKRVTKNPAAKIKEVEIYEKFVFKNSALSCMLHMNEIIKNFENMNHMSDKNDLIGIDSWYEIRKL